MNEKLKEFVEYLETAEEAYGSDYSQPIIGITEEDRDLLVKHIKDSEKSFYGLLDAVSGVVDELIVAIRTGIDYYYTDDEYFPENTPVMKRIEELDVFIQEQIKEEKNGL